jgi:hypothetical protein
MPGLKNQLLSRIFENNEQMFRILRICFRKKEGDIMLYGIRNN